MNIDFKTLDQEQRLLLEAELKPVQGDRFQPTGFPDLGPAEYQLPNGTRMLLVESAQSMANRLEAVCWDQGAEPQDVVTVLKGMPYVRVKTDRLGMSSSLLEFHRLNSPYIMADESFKARLSKELGIPEKEKDSDDVPGALDLRKLATAVFKYDPGSVLHGVFLEKIAGRLRIPRLLSAFIEARDVRPVESGGVKFDHLDPTGKDGGGADKGFGNVPHHRVEFTGRITAFFNLDLGGIRSYGLPDQAQKFLVALGLWKVRAFLETGLRLRTACDLEVEQELRATRPSGFSVPDKDALGSTVEALIKGCKPFFASPPVTEVQYQSSKKSAK